MTKKINFYSIDVNLEINHPQPSSRFLPQWFKKIPGVTEGMDTIKKCMPFLDSMTTGYMLTLAADVYFDGVGVQQISKVNVVMTHAQSQIGEMEIPKEYSKQPYKWNNFFLLKTPKGYSTLFTHPMNRIDLPFYTLSGIVETDKFGLAVNFPFFVKKDFVGIIPAGTPIAQALPFKRTDWKHKVEDQKPTILPGYRFTMHNPPFGFYKKNFWTRKKYE
jgi:hypothetical protein